MPRLKESIFLTEIFDKVLHGRFEDIIFSPAPNGSGKDYVYQLLDGTPEGFAAFARRLRLSTLHTGLMSENIVFDEKSILFCQLWTSGQHDQAIRVLEDEYWAKRDLAVSKLQEKVNIDGSGTYAILQAVRDLTHRMEVLQRARAKYLRKTKARKHKT